MTTESEILKAYEAIEESDKSIFLENLKSENEFILWHAIMGSGKKAFHEAIPELFEMLKNEYQS